ncbi:D-alanyl-D-alanine carboxypeptidase family protein [Ahrensia kielensis]|uniref:D-alanyl-D-alanine carboxypeptidase family protein n=1 Tax=Ahrensia kielensis TaxID=76980 RepID=A0ABU9T4L9_9HYPH
MFQSSDRPTSFAKSSKFRVIAAVLVAFFVAAPVSQAHANSKYAGIVIDARTGKTLYDYKADEKRYPASLTKMMTLYMLFEAMKQGKVKKSTKIRISSHAASMEPSKLGIKAGGSLTAEQAIYALVTKSANDVAAAIGEHLAGTESNFGVMMTRKAHQLGMKSTVFRNASGLPDSRQVSTARDMARLGIALQEHFPREFAYFKTRSFKYGRSTFGNHNRLLGKIKGVDGIKTGYTRASGFNLVTSVNTGGRSIVGVVLGGRTGNSRNAQMTKLINSYLGKASRRGGGDLIAKASPTQFAAPVQAGIASISPSRLPIPADLQRPEVTQEAVAVAYAPVPKPRVNVDSGITTASIKPRSGWVIQIAALDSQSLALDYLRDAQSKASSVLDQRDPFVEVFKKGNATYHRARFAGFASKSDAWDTCSALKRYDYACMAYQK